MWAICRRELKIYFATPLAYVILAAYVGLGSYFFTIPVFSFKSAELGGYFNNIALVIVFLAPLLTMRLWSEEEKEGTAELLLTLPVSLNGVILGKYLAAFLVYLLAVAISLAYPLILALYGNPDWGPIISGYIGLFLFGAACLAAGLFTSSLTSSQMIAAVSGIFILLALWILSWLTPLTGSFLRAVAEHLSLAGHYEGFLKGIIETKSLVYYGSLITFFLFLSAQNLQRRVWGE